MGTRIFIDGVNPPVIKEVGPLELTNIPDAFNWRVDGMTIIQTKEVDGEIVSEAIPANEFYKQEIKESEDE